eukprot:GEMP01011252.1.p1 GENE.GEMP01011252.1~~GEMP01011252.1.p1  ORF type:complete len:717 (+),score=154.06 GEMP01011252.1:46-2196(+)
MFPWRRAISPFFRITVDIRNTRLSSVKPASSSLRHFASSQPKDGKESKRDVKRAKTPATPFNYEELLQHDYCHQVKWVLQPDLKVEPVEFRGKTFTRVSSDVIAELSQRAVTQTNHLYRHSHLSQLLRIIRDPEASENDIFVAKCLLDNAVVSAEKVLPSCQDTGTAVVMGKRGFDVITDDADEEAISLGIYNAYQEGNLRFSQVSALEMFSEKNTRTNLPAQIDLHAVKGNEYSFLFVVKGGGSANKTNLFQKTKATLNTKAFSTFVAEKIMQIGTAACPPYHLAIVVGGLSAEQNLKMVKLASCKYLDDLPHTGSEGGRAFRDIAWENEVLRITRELGVGAQFGGKYFVHDVRVIRLPRHGASCPIGIGVSCSADRQILARISPEGVFLEQLEENPVRFRDEALVSIELRKKRLAREAEMEKTVAVKRESTQTVKRESTQTVNIDLNHPMEDNLKLLSQYPVKTRINLTGTLVVARDIAHARMFGRLQKHGDLPQYMLDYPVYYAGPAKVPKGLVTGSFGPTTAARMDPYVLPFQAKRGSLIMIGKGNRSADVTESCKQHGGFYLGSIGGMAATLSQACIKNVQVLDMEELGMEAVWKIDVVDFPAFLLVDDKGNDFFSEFSVGSVKMETEINSSIYAVLEWFEAFDSNHDMILQVEELAVGFNLPLEEAATLTAKYDLGGFGGLNMDEFIKMIDEEDHLKIRGIPVKTMCHFD